VPLQALLNKKSYLNPNLRRKEEDGECSIKLIKFHVMNVEYKVVYGFALFSAVHKFASPEKSVGH
jgi:hypothetical protein